MSDQQQSESPEFDAGKGWRVIDPEGNVVLSGGVSVAQMDARVAEQVAQAQVSSEGEQE